MFFGSTIMSFALPYAAFIVIATVVFFLLRSRHSGPRLKYLPDNGVTSVITREPGPAPAPSVAAKEATPKPTAEPAAGSQAEKTHESPENKNGGE